MKIAGRILLGVVLGVVTTLACHVLIGLIIDGVEKMLGMENHNTYVRLMWFLWPAMLGFLIALSVALFLVLFRAGALSSLLVFAGQVVVLAFFLPAVFVIFTPPGEELLIIYLGLLCVTSSMLWSGVLLRRGTVWAVAA